jgi:2-dehydro-3-deoxyphosphogluconate aldolase / (4S)-4-hydroxy-2-oxoglutarate aldolase
MEKETKLNKLIDSGLVAVIRSPRASQIEAIASALVEGRVGALEITVDTPGCNEMIAKLKDKFRGTVLVGAGSVLDAQTARTAIEAGADFIFSPIADEETIRMTILHGRISIPGVMTPTEIVKAYSWGADIMKIFPGRSLGVDYIKELRGPLSHIRMMPTGGVDLNNAGAFIRNGAVSIGVGSSLVDPGAIAEERYEVLKELAQQYASEIQNARGGVQS